MATLLSGKELSEKLLDVQKNRVEELKAQGVEPGLAVILVGEDAASRIYVRNKELACASIGVRSKSFVLPSDTGMESLRSLIEQLNCDPQVHGILLQLPLPKHLNEQEALSYIAPEKDVDGFHTINAGKLMTGDMGVVPCTPKGIMYMLKAAGIPLVGKHAVVIGRSNIVGKPVGLLLLQENCTVTLCHSKTANLKNLTASADILVVAIGRANYITGDMIKPGAAVIDVGINRVDGKVVGDVDFASVEPLAGFITPVPGGVGKMTISMLMENTLEAACKTLS